MCFNVPQKLGEYLLYEPWGRLAAAAADTWPVLLPQKYFAVFRTSRKSGEHVNFNTKIMVAEEIFCNCEISKFWGTVELYVL